MIVISPLDPVLDEIIEVMVMGRGSGNYHMGVVELYKEPSSPRMNSSHKNYVALTPVSSFKC